MWKFLLPLAYHHRGQAPCVNYRVADAVYYVGYAADVVEVAVCYKYPANFLRSVLQIFGIWKYVVDTWRVAVAKLKAAVNDDNVVAKLNRGHIAAYFLHTAQRDNAYVAWLKRRSEEHTSELQSQFHLV